MRRLLLIALLVASAAGAQDLRAQDPRIVTMPVPEGGNLYLRTAPDVTQTILFHAKERIASIILSDPTAFSVTVSGTGDSLALRANSPSSLGVMTVRTDLRTYAFELMSGQAAAAPAVVRLVDQPPPSARPTGPQQGVAVHSYRLSGSKAVQPTTIRDDGSKTYIEWADDQAIPATFALGPTGDEQMIDGYMRAGVFTIDRVYRTLIFRIDKVEARASRSDEEKNRG